MGKTDDLCGMLAYWKNRLKAHNEWDESVKLDDDKAMVAIIAKLRAADALCKAAIDAMGGIGLRDDPAFAKLNKAIDDYEEVGS